MRESRSVARKRRMTVLRQMTAPVVDDRPVALGAEHVNHAADIHAFAADCNAKLPLRLRVTDERSGQTEELLVDRPFALIGSSETADVRLVHPDVSRNHAYLQIIEGRLLCCDLASRTGTHWNDEIRSRGWVEIGAPIYIGPFSLRLVDNEFADPPSDEMPVAMVPPPRARVPRPDMVLSFLNARSRSGHSRVSRLHSPLTLVGWSHLCQLRLQHRSVGRVHCSLVWTREGLWVVDLMCRGGTRVNREWINFARLDDQDNLELGRFHLKIAYGSSAEFPLLDTPETTPLPASVNEIDLDEPAPKPRSRPVSAELRDPRLDEQPLTRLRPSAELSRPHADLSRPTRSISAPAERDLKGGMAEGDQTALSLMQQFATMQQQMFDHTYQLLAVVTSAFQTAHNRQLELIREELMRVHDLNRELYELNRQRGTPVPPVSGAGEVPLPAAFDDLQRRLFPDAVAQAFPHPAAESSVAPPPASVARALPSAPGGAMSGTNPTQADSAALRSLAPSVAPPAPAATAPNTPAGRRHEQAQSRKRNAKPNGARPPVPVASGAGEAEASPSAPKSPAPARPPADQDVHAWLSGRINELTQERSTRWQRILQLLTNGGS